VKPAAKKTPDYFRLRAEWLRFKSHIVDADTELPTLAGVLDDVRRLVEEHGSLGLVYLDPGAGGQIELRHGWQAYDVLLKSVAFALKAARGDGDALLSSRDVIAALGVRSDKFLVFLVAGQGAQLDDHTLATRAASLRARLVEEVPRQLPAGVEVPLSLDHGHALLFRDPMLRTERAVHRALDEAMLRSHRRRAHEEGQLAQGLDALIQGGQIVTLYQPIVDLHDRSVLGHEVFTRGAPGGPFEDPEQLFALAERTGRLVDFERLCRARALESVRRHLNAGSKLFLNTSASTLGDAEVAGAGFLRRVRAQGLQHSQVVLEITERVTLEQRQRSREALHELKRAGFLIAIDDMGAGYSSLQSIVELEPNYLKFDVSLVRDIDRSFIKRSLLETLVELSGRIGATVIAEGIEAESEFLTLREMGVRLGQGHFLAPPQPVPPD
jgi:EAL domain-containing protein (putative c-di-GMP-specific phosphodiesterase class I)